MKKVLVIGSTGLLGSHLVKALRGRFEVVEAAFDGAPLAVDITKPSSLVSLFERVGAVDSIVCTAGMVRFVPWKGTSDEDWAHGIANKLLGQINVVRLGAPSVKPGGAIVLTTGVVAQHPIPGSTIVTTVNSGVEGFVRSAALELGSSLRVNAVSPGWVSETMKAMGMDPSPGLPAAQVAEHFVRQLETGATGSILIAANRT